MKKGDGGASRMTCLVPNECRAKTPGRLCRSCNMKRLHADPEFAKANAERMKRLNADRRGFEIPEHLRDLYGFFRKARYTPQEALEAAHREATLRRRNAGAAWTDRPYDPADNSYRSWELGIAALRETRIRRGQIQPEKGNATEERWAREGDAPPSKLDAVKRDG